MGSEYISATLVLAIWLLSGCASVASIDDLAPFNAGMENRAALTFSPDGNQAYWVEWSGNWGSSNAGNRTIFTAQRASGGWSQPAAMPFSAGHSDVAPFVSPDSRWLYFVSDRPVDQTGADGDGNIWRYALVGPARLESLSINSEAAEYSPVITASGALYFASARPGGIGRGDLYRANPSGNEFTEPKLLGPAVNSPTGEWNLWVSPDETEMIFEASSRPTNVSVPGDLYYSWQTSDGWAQAVPISALNSDGSDLLPRLHPDGKTLFYTTALIGGHARVESADWSHIRRELRERPVTIKPHSHKSSPRT